MSGNLRRTIRLVWIAAGLAFSAWIAVGFQAQGVPDNTLHDTDSVTVRRGDGILTFAPRSETNMAGLLFLPGGMVDPIAYAPLLKRVATSGYEARLIELPWRCGCTDGQINALFENIQNAVKEDARRRWVLSGHSRGAMLAARYANAKLLPPAALVLIGTTHPRDFSLASLSIPVTKIYGTRDGIANYATSREREKLLPVTTSWIGIEGGNHVQFGFYRHQLGDESATITRAEQQDAMLTAILGVLNRIEAEARI